MNNLGTLIKFEWKKLLQKKLVKASILVVIFLQVMSNLSFLMQYYSVYITDDQGNSQEVSFRSGYEKMLDDREDAWALDGRKVDDAMLREMAESYSSYTPRDKYSQINYIVRNITGDWNDEVKEGKMYEEYRYNRKSSLESFFLSQREMEYWEKEMEKIETPFTYHYAFAWEKILDNQCAGTALMMIMLLAVCLAGMFSEESRLKTNHLISSAKNGKSPAYLAKVVVGISFGILATLVLYGITFGFHFYFYGTKGFHAILQQNIIYSPYPISVGQAVLLMFGITVLIGVLESMFAMFLSLVLNNNLAAMAVVVGILMLTSIVHVPERYRVLSQIWQLIPVGTVGTGAFFDGRMVKFFGVFFTNFQVAAILYVVGTVVFFFIGKSRHNASYLP
ncbi:MAG: ABC transporter permease subunit [Roseburia sp.]|nr:ABC transporter permease subunit [Roseburia sp.]